MSKDQNNQITLHTNFNQLGGTYKEAKNKYKQKEEEVINYIDGEVINEKKELDLALEKYNNKMKKVLQSEKYKKIENEAKEYSNEMTKNLIKAKNSFLKIKDEINSNEKWDQKKKDKKIKELYDYVLSKFYSQEEINNFNNLIKNIKLIE